jgi:hypothetical protein
MVHSKECGKHLSRVRTPTSHCIIRDLTMFSIVAVHGLSSDPYWAWVGRPKRTKKRQSSASPAAQDGSEPSESVFWLQKYLPLHLPQCRILTFGYRSDYLKSAPKRDIANCAQELLVALLNNRALIKDSRPIIFLAHSLGGIVIKEVTYLQFWRPDNLLMMSRP